MLLNTCALAQAHYIHVDQLDGTNGVAFYHSEELDTWGYVAYIRRQNHDWLFLSGWYKDVAVRELPVHLAVLDCASLNGTNGFAFLESCGGMSSARTANWPAGDYCVMVSSLEESTRLPFVLLAITGETYHAAISLTDAFWQVTMRCYLSNAPAYLTAARMAGNFMSRGYAIAGSSYPDNVYVAAVSNIESGVRTLDVSGANVVRFHASGNPGYAMANAGDVNGDGYDDLLIGAWESDRCWLVFGGRGWSGVHALDGLGSNGVRITSVYESGPPPDIEPPGVGSAVAALGDMNGDGLMDFAYNESGWICPDPGVWRRVSLVYGRPAFLAEYAAHDLDGHNGFVIETDVPAGAIAGMGDVNGDGHNDIAIVLGYEQRVDVVYGGPFIRPVIQLWSGFNGFRITAGENSGTPPDWERADINGDANGDGYDDVLFAIGSSSRATNYAYVVYGGQSPSVPPQIRRPQWINIGGASTQSVEWTDMPTNIIWTGCKKGDDYCLAYTNGVRCDAYDLPMGVLYFTNSYTLSASNELFTIAYTSTNALGPAAGMTSLTLHVIPEGQWLLAAALATGAWLRMVH